ncbi:glycosyltransferase [Humisphaera borealis]|uniref:Glycosyltransferase family 1 protein n=1 Tax=Humisphaera borealis TaxID=2807512 RepID=A0A7M2X0A3_9BACT|nr:glycosyltransferase family 1 protein [Humisphaera borealis]QOV90170.1 glycosyltransferase family 1 protein [Humisphaera borealis]
MHRPGLAISASLAQRPGIGGHAWVILQYLLGFRRLGYRVLFLDSLSTDMCVDRQGKPADFASSWNLTYFMDVMRQFDLADSFSLDFNNGQAVVGVPRSQVIEQLRSADLLINIMGYLADPDLLAAARTRVFLDIDPGFGQMWRDLGWADIFAGHDRFVTVGMNIGRPGCLVPTCGLDWIASSPPIVLEHWPAVTTRPARDRFTSVISWRGPFGPIDFRGRTFGLRCHEFRKYAELPKNTGLPFELALDLHPDEAKDAAMLDAGGWKRVSPRQVACTPDDYRHYVQGSWAELMIAKNLYVDTAGGWFSDRTVCYLASGRPALVQDTGLRDHYPLGEGLVTFSSPQEAAEGAFRIARNYAFHSRRAREIAEAYFDSDRVLSKLLERIV